MREFAAARGVEVDEQRRGWFSETTTYTVRTRLDSRDLVLDYTDGMSDSGPVETTVLAVRFVSNEPIEFEIRKPSRSLVQRLRRRPAERFTFSGRDAELGRVLASQTAISRLLDYCVGTKHASSSIGLSAWQSYRGWGVLRSVPHSEKRVQMGPNFLQYIYHGSEANADLLEQAYELLAAVLSALRADGALA